VNYERNKKGARFFETQCSYSYKPIIVNTPCLKTAKIVFLITLLTFYQL